MPDDFPRLLGALKDYGPDVLIHDPVDVAAAMAAQVLQVPSVSHLTFPAFNIHPLGMSADKTIREALECVRRSKTARKCNDHFIEQHGIDMFANYVPASYHNLEGLAICTGIGELDPETPEVVRGIYGDMASKCHYVGPMLLSKEEGRISVRPPSSLSSFSSHQPKAPH